MEFTVKIDPAKAKDFLQIMRSLQNLGLVRDMEVVRDSDKKENAGRDKTSLEVANQYRDLVD